MTKLIVVHDSQGRIVVLGEIYPGPLDSIGVGAVPREGQFVFEVEKTGELAGKSVRDIHKAFRVDVAR